VLQVRSTFLQFLFEWGCEDLKWTDGPFPYSNGFEQPGVLPGLENIQGLFESLT
jgi:hypothetical protein